MGPGHASVGEIDIAHLAKLANLPLSRDEQAELAQACQEVLGAFALDDVDEAPHEVTRLEVFADEVEPWPSEGIEAILAAVPRRDGRHLHP